MSALHDFVLTGSRRRGKPRCTQIGNEFGPAPKQVLENTPCGEAGGLDCIGRMVMRPSDGKSRVNEAGDFIYIKPGVPHEVFNMSDTESVATFSPAPPDVTVQRFNGSRPR